MQWISEDIWYEADHLTSIWCRGNHIAVRPSLKHLPSVPGFALQASRQAPVTGLEQPPGRALGPIRTEGQQIE
jgi:hypothetical protein